LLLAIGDNHLRAGRAGFMLNLAQYGHSERRLGIVYDIELNSGFFISLWL
jgi:hypothetical protein